MTISGIIPPLVTPMRPDESLDFDGLRRHIDWQLSCGVHGLFVLGTTGEFYALSEAEKQAVTAAAVEHIRGRVPLFVGTGAESTGEVLRLTAMAEREGAAGVSIITPYFLKPTQAELLGHYRRIAESTRLGVVLYSNPGPCGGVAIAPDTVAKLAELPNVIGMKDSSGDLENAIGILRRVSAKFSVLMGRDTLIYAGLEHGCAGAIPATCNVAPQICVGLYEAFRRGDRTAAREYQARLHPVRTAIALATGNGAVKESLKLLGRDAGPNRRPIDPIREDARAAIRAALENAGLLG